MAPTRATQVSGSSLLALEDPHEADLLHGLLDESPSAAVALGRGMAITHATESFLRLVGSTRTEVEAGDLRIDEVILNWSTAFSHVNDESAPVPMVYLHNERGPARLASLTWRWLDGGRQRWAASLDRRPQAGSERPREMTDSLTGLPTRRRLLSTLDRTLMFAAPASVAVLFIDLDRFKLINDTLGHDIGDHVIRAVGHRLQMLQRHLDVVARIGGDEFAGVVSNIESIDAVRALAVEVLDVLAEPISIGEHVFTMSGSIGIALNGVGNDAVGLLANADAAMYDAKRAGRNNIRVHDSAAADAATVELNLRDLRSTAGLEAWFQPVVDLAGSASSFEALARWRKGDRVLGPGSFIPIAERSGSIGNVTSSMLRQSLRFVAGLPPALTVAVNTSQVHFGDGRMHDMVQAACSMADVDPRRLCLEITETALMSDIDAGVREVDRLRSLGCRVAIDDFGVGYGSLALARSIDVDIVKIDESFVRDVRAHSGTRAVVKAIVELGRGLGATVVAEGVEDRETFDALVDLGCEQFQGYFFARPAPAETMLDRISSGPSFSVRERQ